MRFQVGTDVGGTFTDLWVRSDDGREAVLKSPSTADIIGGILNALDLASAHFGLSIEDFCAAVDRFGHGTTAGLNALLTFSAARTALVTTSGFGDTLEIGRLKRQLAGLTELEIGDYTNRGRWPAVVPRQFVVEVAERIDANGDIVVPLADNEIERLLHQLSTLDILRPSPWPPCGPWPTPSTSGGSVPPCGNASPSCSSASRTRSRPRSASTHGCRPPRPTPRSGRC